MTEMHHLAAAYSLDAVDDQERLAFEAHYPTCEFCRGDVVDHRETAAVLAAGEAVPEPPAGLRDRVLAEINRTRQLSPLVPDVVADLAHQRQRRRRWAGTMLAAAAAIAAFVVGALMVGGAGDEGSNELADVLAADDLELLTLVANDETADGRITLAWSTSEGRSFVVGSGLDHPGQGLTYELWLLDDRGATPAGLFEPDADGTVRVAADLPGDPAAWGVTIEPEGGSPAPTGDILYLADAAA